MCNAYNLRHREEAILDIARAMQMAVGNLPDFPPQHRIGIKQRGLILRPRSEGPLAWSWARWSLELPGAKHLPPYPLNNARADKLASWPWRPVQRQRCLIPASGFWEPEKPARAHRRGQGSSAPSSGRARCGSSGGSGRSARG